MKVLKKRPVILGLIFLLLLLAYGTWAYFKPLPSITPENPSLNITVSTTPAKLAWPGYGQSAVLVVGPGYTNQNGLPQSKPIASVAKVIAALCVLQAKPLAIGQAGPSTTMTANDVAIYNQYLSQDGSVFPVSVGQQMSEYDMLQAMLLPSANNIADSLVIWAFGSLDAYKTYATNLLKQSNVVDTVIGKDASGLSPTTISTASDLVNIGNLAMKKPVFAEIVNKKQATLAGGQTIKNLNILLDSSGINGIKTGNSDQAGGVFLSSSQTVIDGRTYPIITAIIGAPDLGQALRDSYNLVGSAQNNFSSQLILKAGAVVGHYQLPWGPKIAAISKSSINETAWQSANIPVSIKLFQINANTTTSQTIGKISASKNYPAVLQTNPTKPSYWWKFTHPF